MKPVVLMCMLLALSPQINGQPFGGCEDCELLFQGMPAQIASYMNLSPAGESGEPLTIEGIIYKPDGKTPAPGIVLYVYHTDAGGRYTPSKGQTDGRRHGHLRGWVKSDANGRYRFSTIRPGSYPNTKNPQHIHPIIVESRSRYYWIDAYLFTDDPLLTESEMRSQHGRGGSGIITLTRDGRGWKGRRDIILGKEVPNYRTK